MFNPIQNTWLFPIESIDDQCTGQKPIDKEQYPYFNIFKLQPNFTLCFITNVQDLTNTCHTSTSRWNGVRVQSGFSVKNNPTAFPNLQTVVNRYSFGCVGLSPTLNLSSVQAIIPSLQPRFLVLIVKKDVSPPFTLIGVDEQTPLVAFPFNPAHSYFKIIPNTDLLKMTKTKQFY